MTQIFHPYEVWEDYNNGMWGRVSKSEELKILPLAIEFTKDHVEYGKAMFSVLDAWPYSCEHNLSNTSINRKAWIGHAACNLKFSWPEYLVRKAWWHLTQRERILADNEALKAIALWEQRQRLKTTSKHGSKDVTNKVSQMRLQLN